MATLGHLWRIIRMFDIKEQVSDGGINVRVLFFSFPKRKTATSFLSTVNALDFTET